MIWCNFFQVPAVRALRFSIFKAPADKMQSAKDTYSLFCSWCSQFFVMLHNMLLILSPDNP